MDMFGRYLYISVYSSSFPAGRTRRTESGVDIGENESVPGPLKSQVKMPISAMKQSLLLYGALAFSATASPNAAVKRQVSHLRESYDFIIAGGGTSGLTVADRLSEAFPHSKPTIPAQPFSTAPQTKRGMFLELSPSCGRANCAPFLCS